MTPVVDASVIFAILNEEPGGEIAVRSSRTAYLSAVNLSESLAKASDWGAAPSGVLELIGNLEISIVPFDDRQAESAAALRPATRYKNVSFADRACLALAKTRALPILTADRKWADLDLGIDIRLIR